MKLMPDILIGIGAAKSGTTWMHDYMAKHPQCQMRSLKEIYFFGREGAAKQSVAARNNKILAESLARLPVAVAGPARLAAFRRARDMIEWNEYLSADTADGDAYKAYLGLRHELKPSAKICGDITPAYAGMPASSFKMMTTMVPDARYVFLVREPVSRFWSYCAHVIRQDESSPDLVALRPGKQSAAGKTVSEVARSFLQGDPVLYNRIQWSSGYRETIKKLSAVTERKQVFLGYYEKLTEKTQLARFCAFLGISEVPYDAEKRINAGVSETIPNDLRQEAAAYFADEYAAVADYSGVANPDEWREAQSLAHRKKVI